MNLYIFGNSICGRAKPHRPAKTFVDILFEKYSVPDQCLHAYAACSEERILYFLKKAKNPDAVIIFHGLPQYFFVPSLERDFDTLSKTDRFWSDPAWEQLNYFESTVEDREFTETEQDTIRNNRLNLSSYIPRTMWKNIYYTYLNFFHTHDLTHNRFQGALTQIDQYLAYKKIPAVHCVLPKSLPVWFQFTTGVVDTELAAMQTSKEYACSHARVNNAVTEQGNQLIADKLTQYLQMVGAVGIEPT